MCLINPLIMGIKMAVKFKLRSLLPLVALSVLTGWGCTGNQANEPGQTAIQEAEDARQAAIDNDPNLTPEQREAMKQHMGAGRSGAQESRGGEQGSP